MIRNAYGEALAEAGGINKKVVALDADVSTCTMSCIFGDKFPDRFFNVGIAEANMVGMAAGMATMGLVPFVHTFAMFCAGRTFDQIRNGLAYPHLNVKVVGTHSGLTVGEDGATHQCLEDLGIMRAIPGMAVLCPCDANETRAAVLALAGYDGPAYLRIGRSAVDTVTDRPDYKFELGKSVLLRGGNGGSAAGSDGVTIMATGIMVQMALEAADKLAAEGVQARVLDMHTIKPLDNAAVIKAARETGAIVTAEEHNVLCGLGSAVAEVVSEHAPVPVLRVGTEDTFGRSGNADKLLAHYGLTADAVYQKAKQAMALRAK
jgi:transketolase